MRNCEIILPRRARPQPLSTIYDGGDCGACVFAGLLGISIEDAYALKGEEPTPFGYTEVSKALYEAEHRGLVDRVIRDIPIWPHRFHDSLAFWGFPSWQQNQAWLSYVRMALDAGYYGIAHVDHGQDGPTAEPDHVVLLCGFRARSVPHETMEGASTVHQQLLVSCSSTTTPDEEWVDVLDFLRKRGGFNTRFARPVAGEDE